MSKAAREVRENLRFECVIYVQMDKTNGHFFKDKHTARYLLS